ALSIAAATFTASFARFSSVTGPKLFRRYCTIPGQQTRCSVFPSGLTIVMFGIPRPGSFGSGFVPGSGGAANAVVPGRLLWIEWSSMCVTGPGGGGLPSPRFFLTIFLELSMIAGGGGGAGGGADGRKLFLGLKLLIGRGARGAPIGEPPGAAPGAGGGGTLK